MLSGRIELRHLRLISRKCLLALMSHLKLLQLTKYQWLTFHLFGMPKTCNLFINVYAKKKVKNSLLSWCTRLYLRSTFGSKTKITKFSLFFPYTSYIMPVNNERGLTFLSITLKNLKIFCWIIVTIITLIIWKLLMNCIKSVSICAQKLDLEIQ